MRIVWKTGVVSEYWVTRRTRSYDRAAQTEALEKQIRALNAAGLVDAKIAEWPMQKVGATAAVASSIMGPFIF